MNALVQTIDGIQEVLAICPCCGEIFRLVEGKFIFPQKRPKTCEYLEITALEKRLNDQDNRLFSAEERFNDRLEIKRENLIEQGRQVAKKKLRKIDPTFSAKNIDPQDVKVIFNPVEYIIFHGLNSEEGVKLIEFISRSPDSKEQEIIVEAIDKVIRQGYVDFETLHMKDDGSFEIRKTGAYEKSAQTYLNI
jgi:predicted Holliday junction resolvase-like endonuclease